MSDKWWDISDDELDDLFRDAAGKEDYPFDPSAFKDLQSKMNPKPSFSFWKQIGLPGLGILLFLGVGIYVLNFNAGESKTLKTVNNTSIKKTNKPETEINSDRRVTEQKHNEGNIRISESINDRKEDGNKSFGGLKTASATEGSRKTTNSIFVLPKKSKVKAFAGLRRNGSVNEEEKIRRVDKNALPEKVADIKNNQKFRKNAKDISIASVQKLNKETQKAKGKTYHAVNNKYKTNLNEDLNNLAKVPDKDISESAFNNMPNEKEQIRLLKGKGLKKLNAVFEKIEPTYQYSQGITDYYKDKKKADFARLGIRLVASPDLNSVESLKNADWGASIGLLLEERLSRKLTLQIGAIWSSKSYEAGPEAYHSWSDAWKYRNVKLLGIDGECKVLDLPINIRYDFSGNKRTKWFASTGFTSLLMLSEAYNYNYVYPNTVPSDYPRYVEKDRSGNHFFSTVNISFGFERKFLPQLSYQVEPYLKVPVSEIGIGKVNLYSKGIMFSLKYHFKK